MTGPVSSLSCLFRASPKVLARNRFNVHLDGRYIFTRLWEDITSHGTRSSVQARLSFREKPDNADSFESLSDKLYTSKAMLLYT